MKLAQTNGELQRSPRGQRRLWTERGSDLLPVCLSINYWKPPVTAEDKTHVFGGVDVGQTPLAVDSELVHYENPKALQKHLRQLRRWQRASARRTPGSRGWREASAA